MIDRRIPPPEEGDPNIADAASLFGDSSAPVPAPAPTSRGSNSQAGDSGGHYEIEDLPEVAPARPASVPLEPARPVKRPKGEVKEATAPVRPETDATVEQVWSRGAEWGGTLALLAISALAGLVVLYFLFYFQFFALAFLVTIGMVPLLVVVGYPILITLERPVRITPEQAVTDFFTALSHHAPHFRRMWLLLSDSGRVSGAYASFEGFRTYWKGRMAELRSGRAGSFTPLKFQVEDFRSQKSAGLSKIDAHYTVHVFVRGKQDEGPVGSFKVAMSLVKGPDRMWYLNKGTLP